MKAPDYDLARLKPVETAARIYCEMSGIPPDGVMVVNHPIIEGATMTVIHWMHAAERMLDLSIMLNALKVAKTIASVESGNGRELYDLKT